MFRAFLFLGYIFIGELFVKQNGWDNYQETDVLWTPTYTNSSGRRKNMPQVCCLIQSKDKPEVQPLNSLSHL